MLGPCSDSVSKLAPLLQDLASGIRVISGCDWPFHICIPRGIASPAVHEVVGDLKRLPSPLRDMPPPVVVVVDDCHCAGHAEVR
jgi:hypothetical protein